MTEILKAIELIEDKRQEKVEIFAKSNEEFLKQYIELENGIPPHDTMQREQQHNRKYPADNLG